jgi:hypothetical protein
MTLPSAKYLASEDLTQTDCKDELLPLVDMQSLIERLQKQNCISTHQAISVMAA